MQYKGLVSSFNSTQKKARVYITELNYVTGELPLAKHINSVEINDMVLITFLGNGIVNGIITSKITGEPDTVSLPDIIDGGSFV